MSDSPRSAIVSKKDVDVLVEFYRVESLRWNPAEEQHLIDAAKENLNYWQIQQRRFA